MKLLLTIMFVMLQNSIFANIGYSEKFNALENEIERQYNVRIEKFVKLKDRDYLNYLEDFIIYAQNNSLEALDRLFYIKVKEDTFGRQFYNNINMAPSGVCLVGAQRLNAGHNAARGSVDALFDIPKFRLQHKNIEFGAQGHKVGPFIIKRKTGTCRSTANDVQFINFIEDFESELEKYADVFEECKISRPTSTRRFKLEIIDHSYTLPGEYYYYRGAETLRTMLAKHCDSSIEKRVFLRGLFNR